MPKTTLNIDRKTASKLLGVSVRTIDRHIRTGRLAAKRENGRIWLNRNEIKHINDPKTANVRQSMDNRYSVVTVQPRKSAENNDFYKDLYDEAKNALNDYRQRLDQSNYRVGQLESQLLHTASQKNYDNRSELDANYIKRELVDKEKEINILRDLVKKERTGRVIFAVLTYLLLFMLPLLWFLLRPPFNP